MNDSTARRERLLGVSLIVAVLALVGGIVAAYQQVFVSFIPVSLQADRSGLLMSPGADVTVRGVTVGKVRGVRLVGEHADLDLGIYPDKVGYVPDNSRAVIAAPTVFGPKFVDLQVPARPSPTPIGPGAVLALAGIPPESNDVLDNLNKLLVSIDPAKLNSALGALSTALQGKGDHLGQLVVQADGYLRDLNPSVSTLGRDFAEAASVSEVYAKAAPDLVRLLNNAAVTSATLSDERSAIPSLLAGIIDVSHDSVNLLDDNSEGLERTARRLRPTTEMLADFSPMFPCLFASINEQRIDLQKAMGYQYPGLHILATLLPGSEPYKYPRDLPQFVPPTPPSCYGGPLALSETPSPHVIFGDGTNGFVPTDELMLRPGSPIARPLPSQVSNGPGSANLVPPAVGQSPQSPAAGNAPLDAVPDGARQVPNGLLGDTREGPR